MAMVLVSRFLDEARTIRMTMTMSAMAMRNPTMTTMVPRMARR